MDLRLRRKKRIHHSLKPAILKDTFTFDAFYYEEICNLTGAGGWSVDFENKKSYLDKQARLLLNIPEGFAPSLNNALQFYAKEHKEQAEMHFFKCAQGTAFETEIKMVTYDKKVFWAKAYGKPLVNKKGVIIGIRGVFQNIDKIKKHERQLRKSHAIIKRHNARLFNFAHIISHNLRSHVSNMQLSAQLMETDNFSQDQLELFSNFEQIAQNLDITLKHLNEIITIQTTDSQEKESIHIPTFFNRCVSLIKQTVTNSNTQFYTEFSEIEEIDYVPAYFESILHNLITNAIRFQHPEREPEVKVYTYIENDHKHLVVEDNGLGIDLDKHKDQLFQMQSKLNSNDPKSTGMGLFITRTQVESLGGKIFVESTLKKGTKFTIRF